MTSEQFLTQYCTHLNPSQREAVQAADGAVLLLAVPGSGKTTVLVTRLGYLVCCRQVPPEQVLTVTYTVAATKEMRARFARMFGEQYAQAMEFRTINGLSQKIIDYGSRLSGRPAFALQENEGELSRLVRDIYRNLNDDYPADSTVRDIRTAITYIINSMLSPEEIARLDYGIEKLPEIYSAYRTALRRNRQMDFDCQLEYALNILKKSPAVLAHFQDAFHYISVDESQDTSRIQHEIIRMLAAGLGNLFMVGDEDQSIYGFRAAYPDALVHFEETYPGAKVLVMEENYRSTTQIVEAANVFVSRNQFRHPKQIQPTCGSGAQVQVVNIRNRAAQYQFLFALAKDCREETAVLFRNNDSAVPLIDLLERSNIPYNCRAFDEVFFSHRVVCDIVDILQFAFDPADTDRFLRLYYKFGCPISKKSAQYACAKSADTGRPVLQELLRFSELKAYPRKTVKALQDSLEELTTDKALTALKRIRYEMGYGEYLDNAGLDEGKLIILEMLARNVSDVHEFLQRLEELRTLIQRHENRSGNKFLLSTIHSSKGLEYDRVYLLDVFDGILPKLPEADRKTETDTRDYEEERRLYYVGMTRAKKELNLFRSASDPSEFTQEILSSIPREVIPEGDFLSFLSQKALGQPYRHAELGKGSVIAQQEERFVISFPGGILKAMTLSEMIAQREVLLKEPEKEVHIHHRKPEKKHKPQGTAFGIELNQGDRITHFKFGSGVVSEVDIEKVTVTFDDQKVRSFLKSSVLPNGKLKRVENA